MNVMLRSWSLLNSSNARPWEYVFFHLVCGGCSIVVYRLKMESIDEFMLSDEVLEGMDFGELDGLVNDDSKTIDFKKEAKKEKNKKRKQADRARDKEDRRRIRTGEATKEQIEEEKWQRKLKSELERQKGKWKKEMKEEMKAKLEQEMEKLIMKREEAKSRVGL